MSEYCTRNPDLFQAVLREELQAPVEERGGAPRLLPPPEPGQDDPHQADFLPDGIQVPLQRTDRVPGQGHRGTQAGPQLLYYTTMQPFLSLPFHIILLLLCLKIVLVVFV